MKILLIRLSSIGDIVLTTPVVRCMKQQLTGVELHFLTRKSNHMLLAYNPYIDQIHDYDNNVDEVVDELRQCGFDLVVDLHNVHRSKQIRHRLRCKTLVYNKENGRKFFYIATKRDVMGNRHVVQRYLEAVSQLGVMDDGEGLDVFLPPTLTVPTLTLSGQLLSSESELLPRYVAVVCGAQHFTKQIPTLIPALLISIA